jgi:hypothetical protein
MSYSWLALPAPLEYHPTFDILDATKIQSFMDSPRRFFYEYILGWRKEEPNIHLAFGSAWHEAMEYMMNNVGNYSDSVVINAFDLFVTTFVEAYGSTGMDEVKNPDKALQALALYAKMFEGDDFRTLYTEVAGTVPIRLPDRLLHVKVDSIIECEDGIWSMEHKSTGNEFSWNTGSWAGQWGLKPQIFGYTHFLRALYGPIARGVKINGLLVSKRRVDMKRIPFRKSADMMQASLDSLNHWVDQIDWNMRQLEQESAANQTMFAFPCNGVSCTKFNTCPYSAFCEQWPNPLQKADRLPSGLIIDRWDPRRSEEKAKVVMHLEQQGNEQGNTAVSGQ